MNIDRQYLCTVIRVVDGDTIDLRVDLGFRHFMNDRFRLWHPDGRFNTPEIRGAERQRGLESKDFVESWVDSRGPIICCHTHKDRRGKYGRWLADLVAPDGSRLTEELLIRHLAEVKT